VTGLTKSGGTVSLSFPSIAGLSYTLEYKNSLTNTAWTPILPAISGNGGSLILQDTNPPPLSRFYRVVRPDMRGLGESSADFDLKTEFTLEHCVSDLLAIADHLGVQSVHVCGESAGGMVCIALAALHPKRVRTLTLVSTPVSIPTAC
jgi:3-oxoadipate enol-lactonase